MKTTIRNVHQQMINDPARWSLYLMDFVDEFRSFHDLGLVNEPILANDERFADLLASTVEYLCDEANVVAPIWTTTIPACQQPWFVAGVENLKAIALAESPLRFRIRKIFVLGNFLDRV